MSFTPALFLAIWDQHNFHLKSDHSTHLNTEKLDSCDENSVILIVCSLCVFSNQSSKVVIRHPFLVLPSNTSNEKKGILTGMMNFLHLSLPDADFMASSSITRRLSSNLNSGKSSRRWLYSSSSILHLSRHAWEIPLYIRGKSDL